VNCTQRVGKEKGIQKEEEIRGFRGTGRYQEVERNADWMYKEVCGGQ
jgi:hypothetical protein